MEFFGQVNIDWMGKAKYFVALSVALLLIGGASMGLRKQRTGDFLLYGIDFKGGTLVYVRFAQAPPVDKIRQGLATQGLGDSVIQQIKDVSESVSGKSIKVTVLPDLWSPEHMEDPGLLTGW